MGNQIAIDDASPSLFESTRDRTLTAADTTGQADYIGHFKPIIETISSRS